MKEPEARNCNNDDRLEQSANTEPSTEEDPSPTNESEASCAGAEGAERCASSYLDEFLERIEEVLSRQTTLETATEEARKHIATVVHRETQRAVAQIGGLFEGFDDSRYYARVRGLLEGLTGIYYMLEDLESRATEVDAQQHEANYENIRVLLTAVLRKEKVEVVAPEPGEPFDATCHQAEEIVAAQDPSDHLKVLRVIRVGFRVDGRPLKPASVVISRQE